MAIRADRVGVRQDQVDIHGRVTSPSFLNELLEDLPEWTDMPVWVNGTEELLPSNNSVPVTSPILTDIAYPDIRRDNQYFTYRESPTPVDGLAKIKSIKGNTLKWNQLVNLIISSTTTGGITYTVSGGEFTIDGTATETLITKLMNDYQFQSGHKYIFKGIPSSASGSTHRLDLRQTSDGGVIRADIRENTIISIGTTVSGYITLRVQSGAVISNAKYAPQIFDLTMLGIDNLTDNEVIKWFADYFPLSYYSYNQGSLLSFNGNGIKTVGKNQLLKPTQNWSANGLLTVINEDGSMTISGTATGTGGYITGVLPFANMIPSGTQITFSVGTPLPNKVRIFYKDENGVNKSNQDISTGNSSATLQTEYNYYAIQLYFFTVANTPYNFTIYPQIEFGSTATDYEPYTSSTLSLPISTYFPNGMKSAGGVYDELTPRKAITRIGAVDMSSMTWRYISGDNARFESSSLNDVIKKLPNDNTIANILCSAYSKVGTLNNVYFHSYDPCIAESRGGNIAVYDSRFTDVNSFTSAMQGVYLYYELATPVELPTMSFE